MRSTRPRWSLTEVQMLAAEDRVVLTRTVYDLFSTRVEALRWVREVIADLRLADFAHTVDLEVHMADVYGFIVGDDGWYLKLTITEDDDDSFALVISCHPLAYPLNTQGGCISP